jgi:tRNA (cmo5U34)-methyltransferase
MWKRYGEYLSGFKGDEYRDHVWAYIEREDTPKPLIWQLNLLSQVGFGSVELLHKNSCFAAFGGIKI